jgi:NAD(P)-dependent dehydrogenase (short-subunit alcohol dehydrogenase family)
MGALGPDADLLVVTGAGGMGQAVVRRLGSGRRVLLADFAPEALERGAQALGDEGFDLETHQVDIGDPAGVAALADRAAALGGFTQLVHTAGLSPAQASPEQIVRVDVVGTALLLDAFGAQVGPGGVGVCIASMSGSMLPVPPEVEAALAATPTAELSALAALDPAQLDSGHAYALAKRANQLRVQAAAVTWGRRGGRVASISPGVIQTPMGRQELASEVGGFMREMVEASPVGRYGTPADIAGAVAFLVGPDASFITGIDLLVDGGVVANLFRGGAGP